jgi:hypothetical protein
MTDQSNIQGQDAQKREHATIHEHRTVQAEEEQGVAYLDIKRNWHTRTHKMEEWILPFCAVSAKVFFMKNGRIGMEYGGRVIVRSIEAWMSSVDIVCLGEAEPEV